MTLDATASGDPLEHTSLGTFKVCGNEGWIGRGGCGVDFYDLFIMRPSGTGQGDGFLTEALIRLEQTAADMDTLKRRAVADVCAARQARLSWRDGPPADQWSIIEARIDRSGALWLTLHEYVTDEYSRWLVRLGLEGEAPHVRRAPAVPLRGDPEAAGKRI